MDFELNDIQKMLTDTVSAFVRRDSPVSRMRELRDDPTGWHPDVWKQMGDLGWLGVPFDEAVGGFGASFFEAFAACTARGVSVTGRSFARRELGDVGVLAVAQEAPPCASAHAAAVRAAAAVVGGEEVPGVARERAPRTDNAGAVGPTPASPRRAGRYRRTYSKFSGLPSMPRAGGAIQLAKRPGS